MLKFDIVNCTNAVTPHEAPPPQTSNNSMSYDLRLDVLISCYSSAVSFDF